MRDSFAILSENLWMNDARKDVKSFDNALARVRDKRYADSDNPAVFNRIDLRQYLPDCRRIDRSVVAVFMHGIDYNLRIGINDCLLLNFRIAEPVWRRYVLAAARGYKLIKKAA